MKLFEYKDFEVKVVPEIWTLRQFKALHDRDKTKGKSIAFKEVAFLYHFCDLKSDYLIETNEDERAKIIQRDVNLPEDWEMDAILREAIDFYRERTITPIMRLYLDSVKSALDVGAYLANSKALLAERNDKGMPVNTVQTITSSLNSINKTIKELKAAEKEVIKEQKEMEGRMKGSQEMSMFEEGRGIY